MLEAAMHPFTPLAPLAWIGDRSGGLSRMEGRDARSHRTEPFDGSIYRFTVEVVPLTFRWIVSDMVKVHGYAIGVALDLVEGRPGGHRVQIGLIVEGL